MNKPSVDVFVPKDRFGVGGLGSCVGVRSALVWSAAERDFPLLSAKEVTAVMGDEGWCAGDRVAVDLASLPGQCTVAKYSSVGWHAA